MRPIRHAILAGLIPLASSQAQQWEVRGRLSGPPPGYPGGIVSIPTLHVGTVTGVGGTFRLRARGGEACYELVLRPYPLNRTVFRFRPPRSGVLDLGDLPMRPYPAHSNDWEPPTPQPQIGDTMGTCTPSVAASEDSWPALHARVEARVTRGDAPLMSMPIDLSCAQLNVGQRSFTDSGGNVSFDLILHFPDDQALVADDRAPCTLRQASVSIDDPLDVVVHFVPVEAARDVTTAVWAIPNPSFQPSSTIGSPFDFNRPVRLGNTLAFRPGVLTGVQFVSVAILPPPRTYDLYPHSSCRMPQAANRNWNYDYCQLGLGERLSGYSGSLLPMAIKVSTGRKQTTTGSTVFLNVPSDVAFALDSGAALDAWARVPLRYTAEQEAYFRIPVSYDPRQHTAQIGLVDLQFDDARNSANDYEALIILFLTRRR